MTPNELATFLRQDWPHIQKRAPLLAIDVHEARKVCDALAAEVEQLREVARAASDYLSPHESGSHPGSGGDPAAKSRLERLLDALLRLRGEEGKP